MMPGIYTVTTESISDQPLSALLTVLLIDAAESEPTRLWPGDTPAT